MLIILLEFRDQTIIKVLYFQKIAAHCRIKVQLKKKIVKVPFLELISLIIRFLADCLKLFSALATALSINFFKYNAPLFGVNDKKLIALFAYHY
jgi:hypothetical protein